VEADVVAQLRDGLSRALEANERLAALVEELAGENAGLRERLARRDAERERMAAELAVLKRMVFGRSSEKGREPAGQGDGGPGGVGRGA
jgi:transposase